MPPGIKDARAIGAARLAERLPTGRPGRPSAPVKRRGEGDVTNLIQEALEEDTADKELTQIVAALGVLLGSLNSSPRT